MKLFFVRRGQELEAAKAFLEAAEEGSLQRAQDASARATAINAQRKEVIQVFQQRLEEMKSAHDRRVVEMNEQQNAFDAQVGELTDQAERVRNASDLLA